MYTMPLFAPHSHPLNELVVKQSTPRHHVDFSTHGTKAGLLSLYPCQWHNLRRAYNGRSNGVLPKWHQSSERHQGVKGVGASFIFGP